MLKNICQYLTNKMILLNAFFGVRTASSHLLEHTFVIAMILNRKVISCIYHMYCYKVHASIYCQFSLIPNVSSGLAVCCNNWVSLISRAQLQVDKWPNMLVWILPRLEYQCIYFETNRKLFDIMHDHIKYVCIGSNCALNT